MSEATITKKVELSEDWTLHLYSDGSLYFWNVGTRQELELSPAEANLLRCSLDSDTHSYSVME